ncbi:MAG TPA: Smr/MutS family protein [Candidatus Deferrimicrobiaceae bacterium]
MDEPIRVPIEDHIDLHAYPPGEAASVVEEYITAAAAAGYQEVRIIHGKGTGVRKAIVRGVLTRHPRVAGFADAPAGAGGWGATRVALRQPEEATS